MPLEVKVKKLKERATLPKQAKFGDAGYDLVAVTVDYNLEDGYIEYGTGLAFEIPLGYVGLIFPRSSISGKDLTLSNSVGVVDSGYRGEVKFRFKETGRKTWPNMYEVGDRIGQLVVMPIPEVNLVEVKELSLSERGEKGFGSTNV